MRTVRVAALYTYPIKSCAGIATDTLKFDALGPLDDRRWMLIDQHQQFITQREVPGLALVRPARVDGGLRVLAPGMPALTVKGSGGAQCATWCWDDRCVGFDEGDAVAEWFSAVTGRTARLLRFDSSAPRASDRHWVGAASGQPGALTRFSDGFPLLVISTASIAELDRRLIDADLPPAPIQRFRPNVVIEGLDPFEEDLIDTLTIGAPDSHQVVLQLVKPCTRCTITEVDPATGQHGAGLLQVLSLFRGDPKLGGAVTFGQNAIISEGLGGMLKVGDPIEVAHRF